MKNIKKFFTVILCMILVALSFNQSFAIEEQSDNYEILLNKGYSAEFLDGLTDELMQRMVDTIGNGYISDIEIKETTLVETNNSLTRDLIPATDMTLTISAGTLCQYGTDNITGVLVAATWEWAENKPLYRGKDAIAINWDYRIFSKDEGSFYAVDLFKSGSDSDWTVSEEYTKLTSSALGALGHTTDLKAFKKQVGGSLMIMLLPENPMIKGTNNVTEININYAHERFPLSGISFAYKDYGIGIDFKDDACNTAADFCNVRFSR